VTPITSLREGGSIGWLTHRDLRAGACETEMVVDRRGVFGFRKAPRFFTDEVTQDYVVGRAPTALVVRAPFKPTWLGLVCGALGRVDAPVVPPIFDIRVTINEKALDAFTIPEPGTLELREYEIDSGELVRVGLSSPHMAWVANSIILASAEDKEAARAEWAAMGEAATFLPRDRKMWWRAKAKPEPEVAAVADAPYRLVARSPLSDFRRQPDLAGQAPKLRTFATPGEEEPLAFSLIAAQPLTQIRVAASSLTSVQGGVIPSSQITIRRIHSQPRKLDRYWGQGRGWYELRPEILLPHVTADVESGGRRDFYLNVRVPENAEPAYYLGRVVVDPGNAPPRELPIELRVLSFCLPKQPARWLGIEYDPPSLRAAAYQGSPYHEEIQERLTTREKQELDDMLAHGVNGLAIRTAIKVEDDRAWVDEAKVRHALGVAKALKLRPPLVVILDIGPLLSAFDQALYTRALRPPNPPDGFFEQLSRAVRRIEGLSKEAGGSSVRYVPYDYSNDYTHHLFIAKLLSVLKPIVGDRLIVACGSDLVPYVDLFVGARCYRLFDEWAAPFNERALPMDLKRSRKELWLAPMGLSAGLGVQPALARREVGLAAQRQTASGILLGAYRGQHGNPFNAFDSLSRGHGFTFIHGAGPLATLAWEGVREGGDDWRYCHTLEALIDSTRKHPRPSISILSRRAERELRRLLELLPDRKQLMADTEDGPLGASSASALMPIIRWRMAWWTNRLADAIAGKTPRRKRKLAARSQFECEPLPAAPRRAPTRRVVSCVRVRQPPILDGKLTDPCWIAAPKQDHFVDSEFGTSAGEATQMQVCTDGRNLYVAFTCQLTDAERRAGCRFEPDRKDAPLWLDPSVHVFLDPGNSRDTFYQIGANRAGALVDLKAAPLPSMDWSSGATAQVASDDKRWTVELAFPLPKGGHGPTNDFWGFNAARRLTGEPARWQVWSPGESAGARPACTGRLVLERKPCYIADVRMARPHVGLNRYAVKLASRSTKAFVGRLSTFLSFHSGRSEATHFKVSVDAGQSRWYTVYQPIKRTGTAMLALALYRKSREAPCSTVIRTHFDVAPGVHLDLSPTYYITGAELQGTLRIHLPPARGPAQGAAIGPLVVNAEAPDPKQPEITFTLRRQGSRRRIHTQSLTVTSSQTYSVRMSTAELPSGRYELDAKVTIDGKTKGTATARFIAFDDF